MTTQPEALRLADELEVIDGLFMQHEAAAELRRLHAECQRLAAEVTNRNRRALEGDEAVAALANVHTHYEAQEKTKDTLLRQALEALEDLDSIDTQEAVVIDVGDIVTAIRQHLGDLT